MDTGAFLKLHISTRCPVDAAFGKMGVQNVGGALRLLRKRKKEVLYEASQSDTMYGELLSSLNVTNVAGEILQVKVIHPFALLSLVASKSLPFFRLIRRCFENTEDGFMRFVLYNDGVVPGNNLRPDRGRSFI